MYKKTKIMPIDIEGGMEVIILKEKENGEVEKFSFSILNFDKDTIESLINLIDIVIN